MERTNHYYNIHNALIRNSIPSDVAIEAAEFMAGLQLAHLPMSYSVTALIEGFVDSYNQFGASFALDSLKRSVQS